ncbi:hypothetical protein E5D57_006787 [Metarhizium anisopliae]|nr:hypothetical protein E5D57_006787 [Metarhizium anisopliae]
MAKLEETDEVLKNDVDKEESATDSDETWPAPIRKSSSKKGSPVHHAQLKPGQFEKAAAKG